MLVRVSFLPFDEHRFLKNPFWKRRSPPPPAQKSDILLGLLMFFNDAISHSVGVARQHNNKQWFHGRFVVFKAIKKSKQRPLSEQLIVWKSVSKNRLREREREREWRRTLRLRCKLRLKCFTVIVSSVESTEMHKTAMFAIVQNTDPPPIRYSTLKSAIPLKTAADQTHAVYICVVLRLPGNNNRALCTWKPDPLLSSTIPALVNAN